MKRILICLLLGFIAAASVECRAQAEKIDLSSDPNFTKLFSSNIEDLRKKAEAGEAFAQFNLGLKYHIGSGITQDYWEAAMWYRKAAEQGHVDSQFQLGWIYQKGHGVEQDYREAIKWYRKAAEHGDANAQYNLGRMYTQGQGVEQNYSEAAKWYLKATEQENTNAQINLGWMYREGRGVKQDYKEAAKWYLKAAEQGNAYAQYFLGEMYYNGKGIKQDYKEAVNWYRKAAEQGYVLGQYKLGVMYGVGRGVIKDNVEAYKWYLLAGMMNGKDVSRLKEYMQRQMTTAQIAEAQRRAKAFVSLKTTGTGFFISSQGYLLTSLHVINGAKTLKVVTNKGIYPTTVIHTDNFNDIAILKVQGQRFVSLVLISCRGVKTGDAVFTIGFPNVGLQVFKPKYTEGVISSLSGAKDDPRYFQISTPVQPGNSGGPLINDRGEVVGIITARLSEASSLATTGALPQNVNYALKSSYVRAFLEVLPKVADQPLRNAEQSAGSHTAQIKRAQEAAALVLSY